MRLVPLILSLALFAVAPIGAAGAVEHRQICADAAARAESRHGLPAHLLQAIALKETGRWDGAAKESFAWPWTVTSGGEGRFYPSKRAAIAEVRRLKGAGVDNIDVGCMQVNLLYHGDAFPDLEAAFDPDRNADYAASFLKDLKVRHGSWRDAVEHYHSSDDARGQQYRLAVSELQQRVRKGINVVEASEDAASAFPQMISLEDLAARAKARQEQHRLARELREQRSREQQDIALLAARQHRAEFEARKARILAEWEEMRARRRAALDDPDPKTQFD